MQNTKRPRGRPCKDDRLTERLTAIRVTPEQKLRYETAAKAAGLSLSAWIKKLADRNSKKAEPKNE